MPVWLALLIVGAMWLAGLICMGAYLKSVIEQAVAEASLKLKNEYETIVTRQSLAEARRLIDANRKYPARPTAGPPAVIHKIRVANKNRLRG